MRSQSVAHSNSGSLPDGASHRPSYSCAVRWFILGLWITLGLLRPAASDFSIPLSTVRELFDGRRTQLELPISTSGKTLTFSLERNHFLPPEFTGPIRTFYGRSIQDLGCSASLVITPDSISAQVFHRTGIDYLHSIRVEPDYVRLALEAPAANRAQSDYHCFAARTEGGQIRAPAAFAAQSAHVLREFRLAPAATAEYTEYFGSKEAALQQLVIALSRADGIFFYELGISFQLVPGFERMVFTDKNSDPYSSNEPTEDLLKEAQAAFDTMIGTENYDLGIVLTRGTYGLAYIRSVCDPARKGSSCIGLPNPAGDAFHVNLVTHELAHQFGANHTFNSPTGLCAERRNDWAAFEPGAGSTIMSYSSLPCGGDSFQSWHDPYFHFESLKEIRAFLATIDCGRGVPGDNSPPIISAGPEYIIPIGTPFTLTATGFDPDGDGMTFCWEERDLGPAQPLGAPDNGLSPLFRSFPPTDSPSRTFPSLENILAGRDAPEERLPQINRIMRFRVTARDSHNHGAFSFADTQLVVTNIAGPFRILSHTAPETLRDATRIQWSTGGTEQPPISATHVRIILSTNGGFTFPIVLAESTPNDGSEQVTLPAVDSENARLKVEPTNNIFFDINDAPLRLSSAATLRLQVSGNSGELRISWPSQPGATYRLERRVEMPSGAWTELLRTNASTTEISIPFPCSDRAAYFRLVRE